MKMSIIKRVLATTLAFALVAAPVVSANAATVSDNCVVTGSGSCEDVVFGTVYGGDCSSSSAGTVTKKAAKDGGSSSVAEIPTTSSVAGVSSSVSGVYLASKVNGTAITTPMANIAAGYGLASNEKGYAKFSNLDAKKSNLAMACINAAAASQNAEVGPCINIELGKMTAGKYSLLPSTGAAIRIAVGVPANFAADGKTFAMVCVREGGVVTILPDLDTNPNTVTFDTTGGAGAYAIIRY